MKIKYFIISTVVLSSGVGQHEGPLLTSTVDKKEDILHLSLLKSYSGQEHGGGLEIVQQALDLYCEDKPKDMDDSRLSSLSPNKEETKDDEDSSLCSSFLTRECGVSGGNKRLVFI